MTRLLKHIVAAVLIVTGAVSCILDDDSGNTDLMPGDTIPDFTVQMNDGSTVTGASLRTGVSVIMFFNTGCPDCQETLPVVQKIYNEYGSTVKFALVCREQVEEEIGPYWERNRYTMPYSPQSDRSVYNLFASSGIPRIYVCKDGIVKYMYDDDPVPAYSELKGILQSL